MLSARVRVASLAGALCALIVGAAACGAANSAGPDPTSGVIGGVGSLPPGLGVEATASSAPVAVTGDATGVVTTLPADGRTLAERVEGNKILLIGDSIMSSISRRYGNEACDLLVPQGWRVEVEAEKSRPVAFGLDVLDRLPPADWDAFVILLGNNYGKDKEVFRTQLTRMLDEIGDRPVLLLTVTEFRPVQREVNEVIHELAAARANIVLLDWAAITTQPSLLGADGLHLADKGRKALATSIAALAGTVEGGRGECLRSRFIDDSAGDTVVDDGGPTTTVRRGGGGTTATTSPRTTTSGVPIPGPTAASTTVAGTTATTDGGSVTTEPSTPPPTQSEPNTTPPSPPTTPSTPPDDGGEGGGD